MNKIMILALSGALGTITRYALSAVTQQFLGPRFPWGTLMVNVVGCLCVGVFIAVAEGKFLLSPSVKLFFVVGFLGAFTTFSTLIYESIGLMETGRSLLAWGNILFSVFVGLMALQLGVWLGKLF